MSVKCIFVFALLLHALVAKDTRLVDVSGVDRDQLLQCLWDNSKPAAFYTAQGLKGPSRLDLQGEKNRALDGYIDYASGRLIKAPIYQESNLIDPMMYDRDNGNGRFQECVRRNKP